MGTTCSHIVDPDESVMWNDDDFGFGTSCLWLEYVRAGEAWHGDAEDAFSVRIC